MQQTKDGLIEAWVVIALLTVLVITEEIWEKRDESTLMLALSST